VHPLPHPLCHLHRSILDGTQFNAALFADDIALVAESKQELQKLLDSVFEYSERWRFKWNTSKSKFMTFSTRRSGKRESLFLGLEKLGWVSSFKYLGIDLQENLSWAGT